MERALGRLLALAALFMVLAAAGAAQARAEDGRRGFLYEIRKGSEASLLFGTIHVGRPEFYPLPASRLSRLERVDALVLEADITDAARALAATQKYALYPAGEDGLDRRLPPATLKRTEAVLARGGLAAAPMMRLKPWMLGTALALAEAARAGYAQSSGAETYLIGLARASGWPILEFEGVERQFALFESAPWATQVAFLDDALASVESGAARREIARIVQAWEAADRSALERLLADMRSQPSAGARFTVDALLLGRHADIVDRIATLMADGRTYLFAVGSLHLVGPDGLVELLRARGYTVTEL